MKKAILTMFGFSVLFSDGYAQFTQVWNQNYQHTTSAGYSNESRKVAVDGSGNIFTLSDVTSDLDINGSVSGLTHHYTVINKYSTNGTLLAEKKIEVFDHQSVGFNHPGSFGLEVDASGNVFAGYCPWDGVWGTNYNVEVAKLDNNLNDIWHCLYVTNGDDFGVDMKVTASGEAYVIANSTNGGSTNYYLLNYASQGAPTTIYVFGSNEVVNCMALDNATEDVYVTGYRVAGGIKNIMMAGINSVTHNLKWNYSKGVGSLTEDDYGTSITIGADGNIYAAGVEEGSAVGNNIVVLKHTARAGKISWVGSLHYSAADNSPIILAPISGYVHVAVASGDVISLYKFSSVTAPPRGLNPELYIADPANPDMGIVSMSLNAMKISLNEKIYITGGITAVDLSGEIFNARYLAKFNVIFGTTISLAFDVAQAGDMTESYEGIGLALDATKSDIYWLVNSWDDGSVHLAEKVMLYDMDVTLPLRETSHMTPSSVSVFPNPASEIIYVLSPDQIQFVEITDLTGKNVRTISVNAMGTEIGIADLPEGLYFCRIVTHGGETAVEKLMVR